ncbi:hypothetical protein [Lignipirellula cremea]|uniref:Uncharacterized protein n=1 Tax=Lignipirellula cremea TaxID=2528010 RepID=A0A518DXD2_9BACT|nr:hypothetical protein [Lignipirellula cremea]QDU96487.1 hypothetical protein Pla8534_43080 [Lignipirellula cremea]
MEAIPVIIALVVLLAVLGGYIWVVSWAINDAQKRGYGSGLIVVLFWIFGPVAAVIWLIARPTETLVQRAPKSYDDPEDALAAASRLDSLGDWDAAAELYTSVAERWPEHRKYAGNCLAEVKQKLASHDPQAKDVP